MAKEFKGLYEFGEFRLDAAERRLVRGNEPVALTLKVFETLLVLVQRSGQLVEKDELLNEVWSDSYVEEANIARHVWILRKALGDDGDNHHYIETVPKLGYRFIAPVKQIERAIGESALPEALVDNHAGLANPLGGNSMVNDSLISNRVAGPKTRATVLKVALGLALVSFAIAAYKAVMRSTPTASEIPIRSIAILPLKSLSGDASDNYLGLGIADAIIRKISQARTITVRPTSAVRKYVEPHYDSLLAAQQLKVDCVLDSTIQRAGDHLRVSVNLLRTKDGASLWADSFDQQQDDLFKMEDQIGEQIATRLRLKLRPTTLNQVDPKAYDCYLRAKFHGGLQNRDDNDAAINLLEEAVTIDPNFAAAYADLATEYRNKGVFLHPDQDFWQEKALTAANKAISLDPDLAEAHVSLGLLLWTPANHFPHAVAIKEFRRALDLNPNLDEAHHQLASVYNHIGLLEKGEEEIQRAVAINPINTGARYRVGVNLAYQSKYEQALEAFGSDDKFNPGNWAFQVAWVLFQMKQKDESLALIEKYLKDYPKDEGGLLNSIKGMLAASEGRTKEALDQVELAARIGKGYGHFHHTAFAIASTYALLNNRDLAVKWLTLSAEDGFPCYPLFERDPSLTNLREDAKFVALMKRLKEQWERYKETE